MSIYYSIGCDRCKEALFIVSSTFGGDCWGADYENLPAFIGKHLDHVADLRVFSEYDDRFGDYKDFVDD